MSEKKVLSRKDNQARALAEYAIEFMRTPVEKIDSAVLKRVELFYRDSVACAVSALALKTNAPTVLRTEAIEKYNYNNGVPCYGSRINVYPEKAILANASAAREWDSNGTLFGYNPQTGDTKGEFGHNDYYAVPIAAAQQKKLDGAQVLLGMLLTDEIRGRLAEVYSLKDKKIDHVVHGAIASLLCYGAMVGANADELESALGLFCAHYIPYRAIRAGKQLSDSKGASAALSTEVAIISVHRAMLGFQGPADIFRNPESFWCLYEEHLENESPFDLKLSTDGADFAVMGMHFKMGLYEHQSASAVQLLIDILRQQPKLKESLDDIEHLEFTIYNPAYGIICDKEKWNPKTRQSADHSLPYIVSAILRKAKHVKTCDWKSLMLLPEDYGDETLNDPWMKTSMKKVQIQHGGPEYDSKYPEGIPTSLRITHKSLGEIDQPLLMFPMGHARNKDPDFLEVLKCKYDAMVELGAQQPEQVHAATSNLVEKTPEEVQQMCAFNIKGVDA